MLGPAVGVWHTARSLDTSSIPGSDLCRALCTNDNEQRIHQRELSSSLLESQHDPTGSFLQLNGRGGGCIQKLGDIKDTILIRGYVGSHTPTAVRGIGAHNSGCGMFTGLWGGRSPETSALPRRNDSASAEERGKTEYFRRGEKERTKNTTFSAPAGRSCDRINSDRFDTGGSLAPIVVETLQGTPLRPTGVDATPEKQDKEQQQRRMRTPRSPRSASAVKDGRKYLLAYRQQRGREIPSSAPVKSNTQGGSSTARSGAGAGGIESLSVPQGLTAALSERIERYQTRAPGLPRSLETALNASLHGSSKQSAAVYKIMETDKDTVLRYREDTGHSGSDRGTKGRAEELSREGDDFDGDSSRTARPSPRTASSSPECRAQNPEVTSRQNLSRERFRTENLLFSVLCFPGSYSSHLGM